LNSAGLKTYFNVGLELVYLVIENMKNVIIDKRT